MMQFNENFIGYPPNTTIEFSGGDQKFMYDQNLIDQPQDWYYRFNTITYEYNSLGHRCKDIKDIDLDNYLLFSGCSHTEGIGLELEKTFSYLVANQLGMDYYNLALGGSGVDAMTYNLLTWLTTVKKLPKAVVILRPIPTRFMLEINDRLSFVNASSNDNNENRFLALGDEIGYFETMKNMYEQLIKTNYRDTKIIFIDAWELEVFDLARDMSHAGNISNGILAKRIIKKLK